MMGTGEADATAAACGMGNVSSLKMKNIFGTEDSLHLSLVLDDRMQRKA